MLFLVVTWSRQDYSCHEMYGCPVEAWANAVHSVLVQKQCVLNWEWMFTVLTTLCCSLKLRVSHQLRPRAPPSTKVLCCTPLNFCSSGLYNAIRWPKISNGYANKKANTEVSYPSCSWRENNGCKFANGQRDNIMDSVWILTCISFAQLDLWMRSLTVCPSPPVQNC